MDSRINTNSPFAFEEKALRVHENRAVILSKNIANASTPHYKAQDVDFRQALQQSLSAPLKKTHTSHLQLKNSGDGFNVNERVSTKDSADGNTVDSDKERADFIENAIRYQASLALVKRQAVALTKAIRGD